MAGQRLHNFGKQHEADKTVDPHHYLLGREREVQDKKEILGRRDGDADNLFPKYTQASVTATGQYLVNGKTINVWTFAQLETLSQAILRQRAKVIRDAVGEDSCPPLPSHQPQDLIRWILHMQAGLAVDSQSAPEETGGRVGMLSSGHMVPKAFAQETSERPIHRTRPEVAVQQQPPGVRFMGAQEHGAARDHYGELLSAKEAVDDGVNRGIVSQRTGGEGRRHINPSDNMLFPGVSAADPKGIQSLRSSGEGRRQISCKDSVMEQKRELECSSPLAGVQGAGSPSRRGGAGRVSETSMVRLGVAAGSEGPIGGERRRHAEVPDRLVNAGMADPGEEEMRLRGRRHLDGFGGSKFSCQEQQQGYQSTWKKDPSKLRGPSQLI